MKKSFFFLVGIIISIMSSTFATPTENIRHEKWGTLDVTLIADERFPTYGALLYFADGALKDKIAGEVDTAFALLTGGTDILTQKQILEDLEYYGTTLDTKVTHEYSLLSFGGLEKNAATTFKMVCHLLKNAKYPEDQLKVYKSRSLSSMAGMVNDAGSLADTVSRELLLRGTPYSTNVSGKLKTIPELTSASLVEVRSHFYQNVKKHLYLYGPLNLLKLKSVVSKECGLDAATAVFERKVQESEQSVVKREIFLVTVPSSTQAQIRFGRYLNPNDFINFDIMTLSNELLGGGFTSLLMQNVRVKKGLTYGISSYAGIQKEYGRAGINTFTKNESLQETLETIFDTVDMLDNKIVTEEQLLRAKNLIKGSFALKFEKNSSLLSQLAYLDHIGMNQEKFFTLPSRMDAISLSHIYDEGRKLFDMNKYSLVVVGDRKLYDVLKRWGSVTLIDYKDLL